MAYPPGTFDVEVMMRPLSLSLAVVLAAACSQKTEQPQENTLPAPEAAAPVLQEQPGYVITIANLLRAPTDDKEVVHPETGKKEKNWLATLYRGEAVTLLEPDGDWVKVRASDGTAGWLKATAVLAATGVSRATVLQETETFSRPTLSALTDRKIAPGTLLLVTKTEDQFNEVNYAGTQTTWILTARFTTDEQEIEAGLLLSRARWLEERKDPKAAEFRALAQSQFGASRLVQELATPAEAPGPAAVDEGPAKSLEAKPEN